MLRNCSTVLVAAIANAVIIVVIAAVTAWLLLLFGCCVTSTATLYPDKNIDLSKQFNKSYIL